MSTRRMLLIAAVAVGMAAAAFFALACTRRHLMCMFGAMFLWIYALLPSIAILGLVFWRWRKRRAIQVGLVAWCAFIVLTAPAVIAGDFVVGKRITRDKARSERIARSIEIFRQQNARLPSDLEELRTEGLFARRPAFTPRHSDYYEVAEDGESYSLTIEDPTRLFGGWWAYDSEQKDWYYYD